MEKTALDSAKRDTIFRIQHNNPAVVVELIENPDHPEYDPRVLKDVDPDLVWSMKHQGQINAATAYKSGEDEEGKTHIVLTSGRQRWKAQLAIWEQEVAAGTDPKDMTTFKVAIQKLSDERDRIEVSLAENEQRTQDEPIERARKVRKYLDKVGDDDMTRARARALFRIPSNDQMVSLLKLLDLTPKAKEAVSAGQISPTLGAQLSRLRPADQDKAVQQFAERTKPPSVREGTAAIREISGAAPKLEMVNLRLVEKRLEKVTTDLDKAMTKLEDCKDSAKVQDLAARVAKLQGWDEALRWSRGETTSSGSGAVSQGNDPMSAAWLTLVDTLVNAEWPVVLSRMAAEYPAWEPDRRNEEGYESEYRRKMGEAKQREDDSLVLFVAGEHIARRRLNRQGVTITLEINTDSKWFVRLIDPHGSATKLIRDWGAHGWIASRGKSACIPSYKSRWLQYGREWVSISLEPKKIAEVVKGTPLGTPFSVTHQVLEIMLNEVRSAGVHLASRFGLPWASGEGEDGVVGPDLQDTDCERESILDQICDTFDIPDPLQEDRTWATVGDLIAWVEKEVQELADPGDDPVPEEAEGAADVDQSDDDETDGVE